MPHAGRDVVLSELRERIERLERGGRKRAVLPFGVAALDKHLPGKGFALGGAVQGKPALRAAVRSACAALFAAGILARLKGPVLWCLKSRDLFAALAPSASS